MKHKMFTCLVLWITGLGAVIGETAGIKEPKVIGYLPNYRLTENALANISKCTDVVYFGSEILGDGRIKMAKQDTQDLQRLRTACQTNNTKLHLCLGGWKKDTHYPTVTADPKLRAQVIDDLIKLKKKHPFNGVDYDWEYPKTEAEMTGFIALCRETKLRLGKNFLVSAAFHPRHKIPKELVAQLDRIHLMTYDMEAPHCAISHSQAAIAQWTARGVPREKLCIGIASYARDLNDRAKVKTYQQMFQEHGKIIHQTLPVDGFFGDNQKSALQKLKLAKKEKLAGVIIWEIGQTPAGVNSILKHFPEN
jgi:GH18 family chitinase